MKDDVFAAGEPHNAPFVELEAEKIIKIFAKQLRALRKRDTSPQREQRSSLVLAFRQQQQSDNYDGAGRQLTACLSTNYFAYRQNSRIA